MAGPGSIVDLFPVFDFNDSAQFLSLLCGVNLSSLEPHDGPPSALTSGGVQLFRIIFDLYIVGLICLVGFVGEYSIKVFVDNNYYYRASAVLRLHVVRLSVRLSVCDVGGSGSHRLQILETNCTDT